MIFNSIEYLLFLPAVALLSYLVPLRIRWLVLLVASYGFYMSWNAVYAVLIALSTVIDYCIGRALETRVQRGERRRYWLLISITANLGLLATFKYWRFLLDNVAWVVTLLGGTWEPPRWNMLLPVGISFYTFQTLSYTIDVYRGDCEPERHFGRFALFVAFFPQLVAGPIERARDLLPQLRTCAVLTWLQVRSGLERICWGLFKKIVVADRLALYVDAVYNNVEQHSTLTHVVATYAFAFQIFCDFSGYSDIAIGSAALLGVSLKENFRQPYFATNIRDFWRRWHISLSTWLRDYLYVPLGGGRGAASRIYVNLMITMLLGGLWHGASWNFVIWGGLQGLMLMWSRATLTARDALWQVASVPNYLRDGVRIVVTFHLVCLSWVFFRANTFGDAVLILTGGTGVASRLFLDIPVLAHGVVSICALVVAQLTQRYWAKKGRQFHDLRGSVRWVIVYATLLAIALAGVDGGGQFIYFQF